MGKKQEIKSLVADAKKDKSSIKKHEKEIAKLQNEMQNLQNAFKVKERNMQNAHDEELAAKKQEIKSLVADAKKDKRAKKSSIKKHEKEIAKLQNAFKVKERNMQNAHDEELAEMKM